MPTREGNVNMAFSEELKSRIDSIVSKHETKQSSVIPVLREIQNEYGWLSKESMVEAAQMLELPPSNIHNVATFYTMFFTKPVGKSIVWVCATLSCAIRGARDVERYISGKLGIKTGETTPDGRITLMEAECLASCGTAPVMLVDDELHECLTKKKVDDILANCKRD